jgi:hypothetical protein
MFSATLESISNLYFYDILVILSLSLSLSVCVCV